MAPEKFEEMTLDGKSRKTELGTIPVDEMDPDTVCGIGRFRPRWLQTLATSRTYLILHCIVGVIDGTMHSYFVGCLSTLEKRFSFKSTTSGTFLTIDEINPVIFGIFVGYFAGRANRVRMVAWGMMMSVACCFLSALPYGIYGSSRFSVDVSKNTTTLQYCDIENRDFCIEDEQPPTNTVAFLMVLGRFLKGFGNIAFFTLGFTIMDDTAKRKNMPLYFCIAESSRLFGPILGFLLSSACLKIYENPFVDPGYGPEDPKWIGAWWLGFVIQGSALFIATLPLFLFPRRLPGKPVVKYKEQSKKEIIKGLFEAIGRLSKNPMYIMLCVTPIFTCLANIGFYVMLPKYMESQFRLSASDANLLSGPPGIASVQISILVGGIIVWKFAPSARKIIIGMAVTSAASVVGFGLLMIPSCDPVEMVGSTMTEFGLDLKNECNEMCGCLTRAITPVCGPDGISTFFSPCHAGCTEGNSSLNDEIYRNCSCVLSISGNYTPPGTVKGGYCRDDDCWSNALVYLVIVPLMSGMSSLFISAGPLLQIRCVDPDDRSISFGLFESVVALLGVLDRFVGSMYTTTIARN